MLNWYVYGEHAPFFYGKEKGYFAAEGIDLEIQEGRGSAVTVQAVAAKTVDFGYADVPDHDPRCGQGRARHVVGVALQTNPMSAMGFAEKNIRKPEDIQGKTVATTPGDSMSQIWPLFLKKTGLKESDFKIVSGDAQTKLNAVINGQADLLLGYVMDQSMKIKDATGKNVYPIMFADYGVNLVSSGIIVHKDYAEGEDRPRASASCPPPPSRSRKRRRSPPRRRKRCSRPIRRAASPTRCTQGFELTIPLYKDPDEPRGTARSTSSDANMDETRRRAGRIRRPRHQRRRTSRSNYYTNDYPAQGDAAEHRRWPQAMAQRRGIPNSEASRASLLIEFRDRREDLSHARRRRAVVAADQFRRSAMASSSPLSARRAAARSTLLKMVAGLLPPSEGEIADRRRRPSRKPPDDVGIVFQSRGAAALAQRVRAT